MYDSGLGRIQDFGKGVLITIFTAGRARPSSDVSGEAPPTAFLFSHTFDRDTATKQLTYYRIPIISKREID